MSKNYYFFNPLKIAFITAIMLSIIIIFSAYPSSPPTGCTGAPSEQTCTGCHGSGNNGTLNLIGLPNQVQANQTYALTMVCTPINGTPQIGFETVALDDNNQNAGNLSNAGSFVGITTNTNGRQYASHLPAHSPNNAGEPVYYSFDWTAPANASSVTFYASSVFGYNNVTNYTKAVTVIGSNDLPDLTISNITNLPTTAAPNTVVNFFLILII